MYFYIDKGNKIAETSEFNNVAHKYKKVILDNNFYKYPVYDENKDIIREANKIELIKIYKHSVLLKDGEIFLDGEIKTIDKPSNMLYPTWYKIGDYSGEWKERFSKEELKYMIRVYKSKYIDLTIELNKIQESEGVFGKDEEYEKHIKADMENILKEINKINSFLEGDN